MSFFGKLGKILLGGAGIAAAPFTGGASLAGTIGSIAGAAGSALGSAAQASASSRGAGLEAELVAEQLNQQRQRDYNDAALRYDQQDRESAADAYKRERISQYLDSPQARAGYKPADINIAGTKMSSFGFGPQATTQSEVDAARQYAQQNAQGSFGQRVARPTTPERYEFDPNLLKPGTFEKFANIAAPIATGVGGVMGARDRLGRMTGGNTGITGGRALPADIASLDPASQRVVLQILKNKGIDLE